ncbi:hypothetical protein C2E23DRAFT_820873 [Lenzites betulinus]|nr:hypothetical protein C2E23DRAFT_820873 [Lenzites betulinus]
MNSSNINDPNAIKALLDHLRSSEAWQKAVNANAAAATHSSQPPAANTAPVPSEGTSTSDIASGTTLSNALQVPHVGFSRLSEGPASQSDGHSQASSVAALLSQLQGSSSFAAVASLPTAPTSTPKQPAPTSSRKPPSAGTSDFPGPDAAALPSTSASTSTSTVPAPTPAPRHDLRACTFQQALPHLARLSADDSFLKALAAMQREQAELERRLWTERRAIQRTHEEKVATARTRASIIGAGLTPYEAEALADSFRVELLRFDRQRVLPAWDGLLAKQQAALEALGVPAMFPTTLAADRERQQEVVHVLGRIAQTDRSLSGSL